MEWDNCIAMSSTSWTVPQGDYLSNDFESTPHNLSTSYNDSISHAFDDLQIPGENLSSSYEDLSPSIDELPPSFESSASLATFQLSSFDDESQNRFTPFSHQYCPTPNSLSLDDGKFLFRQYEPFFPSNPKSK